MQIEIAGRLVDFQGSLDDDYFKSLPTHVQGFADLTAVAQRMPDDVTIFDVGANIGLSAVTLAILKPKARIVAFEPSPPNLVFLRQNVAPFTNVSIVAAAVSDSETTLRFHAAAYGAGSHVVGRSHITEGLPTVDVPAICLDHYARDHGLHPALIKIDVEGHEPEALAGARAILAADRPHVLLEFNTWTLNVFAGHSPSAFAQAIWRAFDVEVLGDPKPNALVFLHDHFVKNHCINDLVMRPKEGIAMPTLLEMSHSPAARAAIAAAGDTARRIS